jgi:predicted Zn-dependent protease
MRDNAEAAEVIFGQVVDAARALGVGEIEAVVAHSDEALTRFANNAIHQNVAERTTLLSVRPVIDGRTARASTNRLSRDAIREVVAEAIAITKLTEPDPDLPPLAERADYEGVERWFEATARATPEERARAVAEAIGAVEAAGQTAAGI